METEWGGKIRLNIRQLRIVIFALVLILILAQIFTAPTHLYYFYAAIAVILIGNAILALPAIRAFTGRASKPGGGGVVGAVKGSIGGGDAADELAEGLRTMGVQAEVVEPDSPVSNR